MNLSNFMPRGLVVLVSDVQMNLPIGREEFEFSLTKGPATRLKRKYRADFKVCPAFDRRTMTKDDKAHH